MKNQKHPSVLGTGLPPIRRDRVGLGLCTELVDQELLSFHVAGEALSVLLSQSLEHTMFSANRDKATSQVRFQVALFFVCLEAGETFRGRERPSLGGSLQGISVMIRVVRS